MKTVLTISLILFFYTGFTQDSIKSNWVGLGYSYQTYIYSEFVDVKVHDNIYSTRYEIDNWSYYISLNYKKNFHIKKHLLSANAEIGIIDFLIVADLPEDPVMLYIDMGLSSLYTKKRNTIELGVSYKRMWGINDDILLFNTEYFYNFYKKLYVSLKYNIPFFISHSYREPIYDINNNYTGYQKGKYTSFLFFNRGGTFPISSYSLKLYLKI